MQTVTIGIEVVNLTTRWKCHLCCEGMEHKTNIVFEWTDSDGDKHRICRRCLESGQDGIRARIADHMKELEKDIRSGEVDEYSAWLAEVAQCDFILPTLADVKRAEEEEDARFKAKIIEIPRADLDEVANFAAWSIGSIQDDWHPDTDREYQKVLTDKTAYETWRERMLDHKVQMRENGCALCDGTPVSLPKGNS